MRNLWIFLSFILPISSNVIFLIIGEEGDIGQNRTATLEENLKSGCQKLRKNCKVIDSLRDVGGRGHWTVWSSIFRVGKSEKFDFLLVLEASSHVRMEKLFNYLGTLDPENDVFEGYGLFDRRPVIIHHFGMGLPEDHPFMFPDFAAGLLISTKSVKRFVERFDTEKARDFTIDAKHELAVIFYKELKLELSSNKELFCLFEDPTCAVFHWEPSLECGPLIESKKIHVMIKTFSGYHRTRLVIIKRTWTRDIPLVEYCSDVDDRYVPTIDLGVNNTERGHCGKTWAILKRFANSETRAPWLIVADDDTLMSFERVRKLLSCYSADEKLIIGERYGYGFSVDGRSGYDYPTGGSGMIFTRAAVEKILEKCSCPADDSPDDMILGMCADSIGVKIVHNSAFHQTIADDYDPDYIRKISPISFHKFENIDPYKDYMTYLHVPVVRSNVHIEL